MSLSYITYKNKNLENCTNFKPITDIFSSVIDTLKNVWVIDSDITNYINSNQTSFKTYRIFETRKPIYTIRSTILAYKVWIIELFAK